MRTEGTEERESRIQGGFNKVFRRKKTDGSPHIYNKLFVRNNTDGAELGSPSGYREKLSGEITVFFALITAVIFALFLTMVESARVQASRLYLTIASNSAIDSLFSQYHINLWEDYRLLGLEYYKVKQLSDEMGDFLKPYLEADTWYPMELDTVDIEQLIRITDDNGAIFENEVLDYMKYGIMASIWDMADIDIFNKGVKEGGASENIADLYDDHASEAAKVEKAIEKISESAAEAGRYADEAAGAASDCQGSRVIGKLEDAIDELEKMPRLVDKYTAQAKKLEEGLAQSRKKAEERLKSGEISPETYELLNDDIKEYESYIAEDGARRTEIEGFKDRSASDIAFMEDRISEAEEVMDYISEWEPEDEDDELDEEELWEPVADAIASYEPMSLGCEYGIKDKGKLDLIDGLKEILGGELLKFVLPEGASLSSEAVEIPDKPSSIPGADNDEVRLGIIDRVYMAEYMSAATGYFGRGVYDDVAKKGCRDCEQEYILYGGSSDKENLSNAVKQLALIRGGLNLMYLYSDTAKRNEARALAMTITGVAALTPLSAIVVFLIMSVWASAQALMDIRKLLSGGKVPFMHDSSTFDLTIDGLLEMAASAAGGSIGKTVSEGGSGDDNGKGLSYKDYLKILMFFGMGSIYEYRCMDVIQMNQCKKQNDFKMDRLAYYIEARVRVKTAHVFTENGLVRSENRGERDYEMSSVTSCGY